MCHSLQSQEQVGFGTGLVQALARQVICFHSRSGAALHCCKSALVMTPGWSAAGGGFCGSPFHLPQLHMNVGQEDVSTDLSSISVPQVVSFGSPLPCSREQGPQCHSCTACTAVFSELLNFLPWSSGHSLAGVSFQQWAARCGCADPSAFELVRY